MMLVVGVILVVVVVVIVIVIEVCFVSFGEALGLVKLSSVVLLVCGVAFVSCRQRYIF